MNIDRSYYLSKNEIKEFFHYLEKAEKITISGHYITDPDCITSVMVLGYILKHVYEKDVDIVFDGDIRKNEKDYAEELDIELNTLDLREYKFGNKDMIIIVDTPTNRRLTPDYSEIDLKQFAYKIIIDHHKKELSDDMIDLDLRRRTAAATELFLQIFEDDIKNDPKGYLLAEILLYGLIDDTEQYATPYTQKQTFSSVQKLIDLGADYRKALMNIISQPISHLKSISKLVSSLELRELGYHSTFIYNINLPENRLHRYFVLKDFKAKVRDASDIDLAIIYQERKEIKDGFEYSFRVRSLLGLKEFYKLFENSGGHSNAGGGRITAKNDKDVVEKMDKKIKKYFDMIDHTPKSHKI